MPGSHIGFMPSMQTMRGPSLVDGTDLTKFFNLALGMQAGLVAHASGGIPLATPLNAGFNSVDTVATIADSVLLPPAIIGSWCWVANGGAASMSIYNLQSNWQNGSATDVITPHGSTTPNAGNAAVTLAAGHTTLFVCMALGKWKQVADFG